MVVVVLMAALAAGLALGGDSDPVAPDQTVASFSHAWITGDYAESCSLLAEPAKRVAVASMYRVIALRKLDAGVAFDGDDNARASAAIASPDTVCPKALKTIAEGVSGLGPSQESPKVIDVDTGAEAAFVQTSEATWELEESAGQWLITSMPFLTSVRDIAYAAVEGGS